MTRDLTIDLRDVTVTQATRRRYNSILAYFFAFCQLVQIVLGDDPADAVLDDTAARFIQFLYEQALPKYHANLVCRLS